MRMRFFIVYLSDNRDFSYMTLPSLKVLEIIFIRSFFVLSLSRQNCTRQNQPKNTEKTAPKFFFWNYHLKPILNKHFWIFRKNKDKRQRRELQVRDPATMINFGHVSRVGFVWILGGFVCNRFIFIYSRFYIFLSDILLFIQTRAERFAFF